MTSADDTTRPALPATRAEALEAEDPDYQAILGAVMETARGRWFLSEFARLNRTADTRMLLAALDRVESVMRAQHLPDFEQVRAGLGDVIEAVRAARRDIAAFGDEDRERIRHQDVEFAAEAERGKAAVQTVRRAAERIQEIAWGLREREVSRELCDALDGYSTDVLTACRSQDGTMKGMAAMARAMRRIETRVDGLLDTLAGPADETAAEGRVAAEIHQADPEAGRFLEALEEEHESRFADRTPRVHDQPPRVHHVPGVHEINDVDDLPDVEGIPDFEDIGFDPEEIDDEPIPERAAGPSSTGRRDEVLQPAEVPLLPGEPAYQPRSAATKAGPHLVVSTQGTETRPIETAPIEKAPVETAPIEPGPIGTGPIETAPTEIAASADQTGRAAFAAPSPPQAGRTASLPRRPPGDLTGLTFDQKMILFS